MNIVEVEAEMLDKIRESLRKISVRLNDDQALTFNERRTLALRLNRIIAELEI